MKESPLIGTWRMVCIGGGPGPKNVLAERAEDGFRVVVPYRRWKNEMSRAQNVYSAPTQTTSDQGRFAVDIQVGILQVAVRNAANGRQIFDVSCSDGKTRQVWDAALANAINAFAGSGANITIRYNSKQNTGRNGQVYNNESITAFAPPGQALPPEQAGGGGGPGGFRGGGGGRGMSASDKTRIAKMGAQGSAATVVAALFQSAGPEAYDEAVALLDKLTLKLYKSARSHESEAEIKGESGGGATVLQPGAAVGDATPQANVLPQGATPADVAAAVPGVQVGAQVLQAGGAADQTAAADVTAQNAHEQGDDIDWN